MEPVYLFGAYATFAIGMLAWIWLVLCTIKEHFMAAIEERTMKMPFKWMIRRGFASRDKEYFSESAVVVLMVGPVIAFVIACLWPIAWTILLYNLSIRGIRLVLKAKRVFKEHKHGEDGAVL